MSAPRPERRCKIRRRTETCSLHRSLRWIQNRPSKEAYRIAERFHPAWERLDPPARALHARNAHQILGRDLSAPAGVVICWTENGSRDGGAAGTGGTGQALRIAAGYGVPVLNIALSEDAERVRALLASAEGTLSRSAGPGPG